MHFSAWSEQIMPLHTAFDSFHPHDKIYCFLKGNYQRPNKYKTFHPIVTSICTYKKQNKWLPL